MVKIGDRVHDKYYGVNENFLKYKLKPGWTTGKKLDEWAATLPYKVPSYRLMNSIWKKKLVENKMLPTPLSNVKYEVSILRGMSAWINYIRDQQLTQYFKLVQDYRKESLTSGMKDNFDSGLTGACVDKLDDFFEKRQEVEVSFNVLYRKYLESKSYAEKFKIGNDMIKLLGGRGNKGGWLLQRIANLVGSTVTVIASHGVSKQSWRALEKAIIDLFLESGFIKSKSKYEIWYPDQDVHMNMNTRLPDLRELKDDEVEKKRWYLVWFSKIVDIGKPLKKIFRYGVKSMTGMLKGMFYLSDNLAQFVLEVGKYWSTVFKYYFKAIAWSVGNFWKLLKALYWVWGKFQQLCDEHPFVAIAVCILMGIGLSYVFASKVAFTVFNFIVQNTAGRSFVNYFIKHKKDEWTNIKWWKKILSDTSGYALGMGLYHMASSRYKWDLGKPRGEYSYSYRKRYKPQFRYDRKKKQWVSESRPYWKRTGQYNPLYGGGFRYDSRYDRQRYTDMYYQRQLRQSDPDELKKYYDLQDRLDNIMRKRFEGTGRRYYDDWKSPRNRKFSRNWKSRTNKRFKKRRWNTYYYRKW